ncbi:MAG: COX15/CtaA family protein, partial [Myxococcales bacterium]|nr:COX15/CtaA family protein [Myxococcales bacterium]
WRLWRGSEGRRRWLGPIALLMVIVQGVLGGLTVIFELVPSVSTAHLGLSLLFLGLVIYVWLRGERGARLVPVGGAAKRKQLAWVMGALYLQILLGGLVRHTQAGMACGLDPILCLETLWPGTSLAQLHMLHRIAAVLLGAAIAALAWGIGRAPDVEQTHRRLALGAVLLVLLQVGLGMLSVMSVLSPWTVTAHLAVAALLLGSLWALWLLMRAPFAEAFPARDEAADALAPC